MRQTLRVHLAQSIIFADDNVTVATFEAEAMAIEFRGKKRRVEDRVSVVDEDVVVGGKIVPLEALDPIRVEVVEVGSSTVVPVAPRAIQERREREVVQGAPAGPRGRGGTGVGMGPSRGRGLNSGYALRSGGSVPGGGAFRSATGGFYARGRGRGLGGLGG